MKSIFCAHRPNLTHIDPVTFLEDESNNRPLTWFASACSHWVQKWLTEHYDTFHSWQATPSAQLSPKSVIHLLSSLSPFYLMSPPKCRAGSRRRSLSYWSASLFICLSSYSHCFSVFLIYSSKAHHKFSQIPPFVALWRLPVRAAGRGADSWLSSLALSHSASLCGFSQCCQPRGRDWWMRKSAVLTESLGGSVDL